MAVASLQVQKFIQKKLDRIFALPDNARKAALANLRQGVGQVPGNLPRLWGEFLQDMPQEMYGMQGTPSYAQWAIYVALTLFALHQQGKDLNKAPMHQSGRRLGEAVAQLIDTKDDMVRVWRRFSAMANASDIQQAAYYLRGIVRLLRDKGVALDYVALAVDLFQYQFPEQAQQVRLQWGQDFYREHNSVGKKNLDQGKEDIHA